MPKGEGQEEYATGLAKRLREICGGEPSELASRMEKAGWRGSYERVRKLINEGDAKRISADLVAYAAKAYPVDARWLLTGDRESVSSVDAALTEVEDAVREIRARYSTSPAEDEERRPIAETQAEIAARVDHEEERGRQTG